MIELTVNGQVHVSEAAPDTPLLYVPRNELGLNGAKFGCGLGQCGACTVLVGGRSVFACLVPISILAGRSVETLEGLGTADDPGPVQAAFIEAQAAQCGYCLPGMIVRAEALLRRNPDPDEDTIRDWMAPNLCRCRTHMRILRAIRRAAELRRAGAPT